MKITVNDIESDWNSSFLDLRNNPEQTTWSKKREDYFCEETIEGIRVFIKRYRGVTPETSFLKKIQNKKLINLPRVYDIVTTKENNRSTHYTFQEFIDGDILDGFVTKSTKVKLDIISTSLIRSIKSIHEQNYWHTDINCENVIVKKNSQCYIIDLDSCEHFNIKPTHLTNSPGALTTRSNQLASHILKYYQTFLHKGNEFTFSHLHGKALNLLQILFLVQQVKFIQNRNYNITTWKKSTFNNIDLITDLRSLNPFLLDELFLSALDNSIEQEKLTQFCKLIEENLYKTAEPIVAPASMIETKIATDLAESVIPNKSSSILDAKKAANNQPKKQSKKLILLPLVLIAFCGFLFLNRNNILGYLDISKKKTDTQTLSEFFTYLNDDKNNLAYDLSSNPKWTPLSKFNSNIGWGGFENIQLKETTTYENNLLAYYKARNVQEDIIIHRLNGFEFDNNTKISRLTYFPRDVRNSLTKSASLNTVHEFFRYVQEKNFHKAHYFTSNPIWGDVDFFSSSVTGWGGLSKFNVIETKLIPHQCHKGHELIYVKYYEEDPINDNYGTREMYYHMDLKNQEYKIVRATLSQNGD